MSSVVGSQIASTNRVLKTALGATGLTVAGVLVVSIFGGSPMTHSVLGISHPPRSWAHRIQVHRSVADTRPAAARDSVVGLPTDYKTAIAGGQPGHLRRPASSPDGVAGRHGGSVTQSSSNQPTSLAPGGAVRVPAAAHRGLVVVPSLQVTAAIAPVATILPVPQINIP